MKMNYAVANLILCVSIIVIIIVYVIFVYICYTQKLLMYSTYKPVAAPDNAYYPLGKITTLTAQQISDRNTLIQEALSS
jgi:hypothetical protein